MNYCEMSTPLTWESDRYMAWEGGLLVMIGRIARGLEFEACLSLRAGLGRLRQMVSGWSLSTTRNCAVRSMPPQADQGFNEKCQSA
jgi:hypothetical protein